MALLTDLSCFISLSIVPDKSTGIQIQSNLNGSNIFGTMEIRSRHG